MKKLIASGFKIIAVFLSAFILSVSGIFGAIPAMAATNVTPHFEFQLDGTAVIVSNTNVASTSYSVTYTGSQITPTVSNVVYVKADGTKSSVLDGKTDYTVIQGENTNADNGNTKGGSVTIMGKGDYSATTMVNFSIKKATPSVDIIGNTSIRKTYDGEPVNITEGTNFTVSSGTNSSVTYSNLKTGQAAPVDAGTYTATIKATVPDAQKNNYTTTSATKTISITIDKASIENATVSLVGGDTKAYTGSQIKPEVAAVTLSEQKLTSDVDYNKTPRYAANKDAGSTGYVYVDAKSGSNYTGTATGKFTISAAAQNSIADANIKINGVKDGQTAEYAYTGNPITPGVTVWMGKTQLSTADYDVSYTNNVSVGTATITVTGKRNYSPATQATTTFTIKPNEITSASIKAIPDQEYNGGDEVKPVVTVTVNGKTVNPSFYTVTYSNNIAVGKNTAVVRVMANGGAGARYTGSGEKTFTIKEHEIKAEDVEVSDSVTYTGSNVTPTIKVYKNSNSDETLTAGTDYTATYNNNTNVGRATATIKGKEPNYTGTVTKYFQIVNGEGTIDISDATIRDIADQTYNGNEIKPSVSVTFNGQSFSSSNYDVKYFNNVNAGQATVYIYGKGKYTGSARKTFLIKAANINGASVSELPAQKYTGYAVQPIPTVTFGGRTLSLGKDYTLGYDNNVNKGTGYVLINGAGNFTGSKRVGFSITDNPNTEKVWATSFILPDRTSLLTGSSTTLTPALTPENANTYTIRWSTSNPDFVFMDGSTTNTAQTTDSNGAVVRANKEGSTVITAELFDENSKSLGKQYTLVRTVKSFSDVANDYSTNAINTLANYGYTTGSRATQEFHSTPVINGTSSTTFTPSGDVKRADFVLMLYNKAVADYAAGKTTVDPSKAAAAGFTDVSISAYYASAINWAVANGIAEGKGNNNFDPNGTVTRGEAVTFLQRYLKGSNGSTNKFTDVSSGAYYAGAVGWAVANGVTDGTSATTFSPNVKCNRAQAATFIYRAAF